MQVKLMLEALTQESVQQALLGRSHVVAVCQGTVPERGKEETQRGGAAAMRGHLPYFCRGQVVKGLGRGSKELGIPTANFSEQVVESFPSDISTGIYYGWACVGNGDVHKMVLSIGWNPFYKNIKKSVETHVIHTFKEDFYGEILRIVVLGYIRSEKNFSSLEALISAIQEDIEEAKRQLDLPEHLKLKEDNFFHLPEGKK
ncbi:riboflavin kinase-like [Rhynochetos jubatus]